MLKAPFEQWRAHLGVALREDRPAWPRGRALAFEVTFAVVLAVLVVVRGYHMHVVETVPGPPPPPAVPMTAPPFQPVRTAAPVGPSAADPAGPAQPAPVVTSGAAVPDQSAPDQGVPDVPEGTNPADPADPADPAANPVDPADPGADPSGPADPYGLGNPYGPYGPGLSHQVDIPFDFRVVALLILSTLPLAARRRYPLAVFWVVFLALLGVRDYQSWLTVTAFAVAAGSAVLYGRLRLPTMGSFALALGLVCFNVGGAGRAVPEVGGPYLLVLVAVLIASVIRFWQERLTDSQLRLEQLQEEQQEAMARAVAEERSRIAAELHDVVTHNVSVMVIQAGAARKVMASRPEKAAQALLAVEAGGRAAMAELRHVMGLLAAAGTGRAADGSGDELEPQPGLAQLADLVDRVRAAGLPVEVELDLPTEPLLPGIDLAAYRVVQEALTNTLKHAIGARARVTIGHRDGWLELTVRDTGGEPNSETAGGGRGLIGLRERLAVYHGTLEAGPTVTGGYLINARLRLDAA
ncbi:sensor histidine kinase [Kitasatospora sp. NPDC058965]|uniref:sensor histidine kinase n=1 Tax=Kitasatospora sp. NPDC058965 TaxID=3346682 RepID=UPI0036C7C523